MGLDYGGKNVLAPMVRVGATPMRLLALEMGADIVYTEETVDKRLAHCRRVENAALGTVDFVDGNGHPVLRTCAEERESVVLQLGTASPDTAVPAALLACRDVAAVDVNMGCPKAFSLKGGMGANLLRTPDVACDILKGLRRALPAECGLSCKIRLLETPEQTVELARRLEMCGIDAMGVHGRFVPQRPREPAHWDRIKDVVDALKVPVIANGDVFRYEDFQRLRDATGATAAMTARAAQWNASVFRPEGFLPVDDVIARYIRKCFLVDNAVKNTKYTVKEMLIPMGHAVLECKDGKDFNRINTQQELSRFRGFGLARFKLDEEYDRILRLRLGKRGPETPEPLGEEGPTSKVPALGDDAHPS